MPYRVLFFAATLLASATQAQETVQLQAAAQAQAAGMTQDAGPQPVQWELVDRYRLFDRADEAARSRVDRLLGELADAPADHPDLAGKYGAYLRTLSGADAASLRQSNWDQAARQYRSDYLEPRTYQIRARLTEGPSHASCSWSIDGEEQVSASCDAEVLLAIPGGRNGGRWGGSGRLDVRTGDRKVAAENILIEDRLIVALGDSFISGEGNPDVPADLAGITPTHERRLIDWPAKIDPDVPGVRIAEWWDEPCHRSLLSWPVVSTLAFAARDSQRAVTLVHLGCSGATVPEGLLGPQGGLPGCPVGLDHLRTCPVSRSEGRSQVDQLERLLGENPRRPIDKFLLSIGGNDIGFVGVIAYGILPPRNYRLGRAAAEIIGYEAGVVCPDGEPGQRRQALCTGASATTRLGTLPAEYNKVETALGDLGVRPESVLQTQYPDLLHDDPKGETFCHHAMPMDLIRELPAETVEDRRVRDLYGIYHDQHIWRVVPGGFETTQSSIPSLVRGGHRWAFQYDMEPYYVCSENGGGQSGEVHEGSEVCASFRIWRSLNAAVAANQLRKWTIVTEHVETTRGHGWCRSDRRFPLDLPVAKRDPARWRWWEDASYPTWFFDRDRDDRMVGGQLYEPLATAEIRGPAAYDPYAFDQPRWFRTANDSLRTQYGGPGRLAQGTVHPTFRAHVAYAEAVLKAGLE